MKEVNKLTDNEKTIDVSVIIISDHTIERFLERSKKMKQRLKNPKLTLLKFLSKAVLTKINPAEKVRRIIDNDFQIADYYEYFRLEVCYN